jgi:apolipoprotein N-acyltransferase
MAVLRGVEGGFSIARAADLGILTATDDRGSVLSERDTVRIGAPFATVVAEVPVRHDITIYSRLGDWFAWLCIAVFLLAWLGPQKTNRQQLTAESKTETVAASA